MNILMTRWFVRFAKKCDISEAMLIDAVLRAERGLVDADLGGNLIKQRVARQGRGRSGGYRTIIAIRKNDRAIFVYGFAKSARDNIGADDLEELRDLGFLLLGLSDDAVAKALAAGELAAIGTNNG